MPTIHTEEFILSTTIGTINTTADRASLGRVARINRDEWHARELTFVLKELSQLVERPTVQCRSVSFSSLYPFTDTRQFFDGDSLAGALSLFDNALADNVVRVSGKALFFARQLLEAAARGLRTLRLQLAPQLATAVANRPDCLALVDFACAVYGNVGHAQVNAQEAVNVRWRWFLNFTGGEQVKLAVNQAQVRFAALPLQEFQLPLPCQEGDSQATVNRPNAYLLLGKEPAQNTRIVGNATMPLESALAFLVQLVSVGNFADGADDNLSRQTSGFANGGIHQLLKAKLIKCASLPSNMADFIARRVGCFQRGKQGLALFWRGLQLHFGGQFHTLSIAYLFVFVKCLT